ncbi:GNAT family N-acetyltransferase [Arthrobacter sp. SW1]|uniref:GNAT family N-acetyltransferase n=1 Tax=Arthrobacter sp. SW1 TaxID=1920889 RepID=UPI000877CEDA|nr:GNAT family N-acetyltransferase [Arthrobacter sp. SW1]OFI39593.1 GNAT family N-acetyltransferase [Arthrobacter sp. SW1]
MEQEAGALVVRPAQWPEVEELFGERGEPARCWCRWFKVTGKAWDETPREELREQLKKSFDAGPEPGVIALRDGTPVGWCAVEPRQCYPRIERSQVLRSAGKAVADGDGVWSVSCFVVAPGQRRSGIAGQLLAAAVEHAFAHGARIVEGYPVDPALRPKAGSSDLYHGTVSIFTRAGFEPMPSAVPGRAVMRLQRPLSKAGS